MNNYKEIRNFSEKVGLIDGEQFDVLEEDTVRQLCVAANYRFMGAYRKQLSYALQLLHAVKMLGYASRVDSDYYDRCLWHIDLTLQIAPPHFLDIELLARAFFESYVEREGNMDEKDFIEQWLKR